MSTSLLSSDDQLHHSRKKAKSMDIDRNHHNKKYKLDNQKISKEFSQDFLDEYKQSEAQQLASQPRKSLISKSYESDANHTDGGGVRRGSSSDGGAQVPGHTDIGVTLEDEEDFLFYNNKKHSMIERCCCCLFPYLQSGQSPLINQDNSEDASQSKPCGMFGDKTYFQVCEEMRLKSVYRNVPGQGYISLIVKSGDDLR